MNIQCLPQDILRVLTDFMDPLSVYNSSVCCSDLRIIRSMFSFEAYKQNFPDTPSFRSIWSSLQLRNGIWFSTLQFASLSICGICYCSTIDTLKVDDAFKVYAHPTCISPLLSAKAIGMTQCSLLSEEECENLPARKEGEKVWMRCTDLLPATHTVAGLKAIRQNKLLNYQYDAEASATQVRLEALADKKRRLVVAKRMSLAKETFTSRQLNMLYANKLWGDFNQQVDPPTTTLKSLRETLKKIARRDDRKHLFEVCFSKDQHKLCKALFPQEIEKIGDVFCDNPNMCYVIKRTAEFDRRTRLLMCHVDKKHLSFFDYLKLGIFVYENQDATHDELLGALQECSVRLETIRGKTKIPLSRICAKLALTGDYLKLALHQPTTSLSTAIRGLQQRDDVPDCP